MKNDLLNQKCVPCEGGTEPMDEGEVKTHLSYLKTSWEVEDGKQIEKKFEFKDFKEAMEFVNKVADIAENEGHHPDIKISYNKVKIELSTHAIKGLSPNDFIVARKIELLTTD
ncbi:MAG: 4a-hydroxytetrahydrobiopterin dehydratase [Candidatus Levybacteria bacterium CG10_big_fil_rev_8_21_14_0_10_36_7]|nr:MAG: 4a-hydroxytetrahydrobiopterin dehydratase [Candidatus Levybacteria bacterium CG10_big_fil_rev_8_21_14_0_10_36_7]